MERDEVRFKIGRYNLDVKINGNALEIYCGDAGLVAIPKSGNVFQIRPEPFWGDNDKARILSHKFGISDEKARGVVDFMSNQEK